MASCLKCKCVTVIALLSLVLVPVSALALNFYFFPGHVLLACALEAAGGLLLSGLLLLDNKPDPNYPDYEALD